MEGGSKGWEGVGERKERGERGRGRDERVEGMRG